MKRVAGFVLFVLALAVATPAAAQGLPGGPLTGSSVRALPAIATLR
jgi:hypothetical protein